MKRKGTGTGKNAYKLRQAPSSKGIDTELFDMSAHIDRSLSYQENKENLLRLSGASRESSVAKHARKTRKTKSKAEKDPFYQTKGSGLNKTADKQRKAKLPGVRGSKSGKTYTERRPNRSDRYPHLKL